MSRPGLVEVGTFMDPKMHQRYFAKIMINQATVATIISNFRLRFDLFATFCNILQHFATFCNILQHFATFCNLGFSRFFLSSWCTLTTRRTSLGRSLRFSRQESLILTSLQLNMIAMRSDYLILCVTTCYNNCVWITNKARIISAVASEIEHVLGTAGATLVATAGTSDSETQIRSRAPRLKGGNETC